MICLQSDLFPLFLSLSSPSGQQETPFPSPGRKRPAAIPAPPARVPLPLRQAVDEHGVDVAVRLGEDGLVRVDVGAVVFPVPEHVAVLLRVARRRVVGDAVVRAHEQVDAVARVEHDARGAQLGVQRLVEVRVAPRQPDGLLARGEGVDVGGVGVGRRRVHEELHADEVGRPHLGLHVELRPAVGRHAHQLGLDVDLGQEDVAPARALAPVRQEGPPHARVEHQEPLVPLVQLQPARAHAQLDLVPPEHLAVCAQVVARVGPVDGADVGRALRDEQLLGRLVVHAVEDEDEVGCGV